MFSVLKNFCKNVKKLNGDRLIHDALEKNPIPEKIIELNQDQLYNQGVYADGTPTGDYAANTIEGKEGQYLGKIKKGQRYDHITFRDTGALYDSMKFGNKADEFIIAGDTIKDGIDLQERDGKIIGLTKESKREVAFMVKPIIIRDIKNIILRRK